MSIVPPPAAGKPIAGPDANGAAAAALRSVPFRYHHSDAFAGILRHLKSSLLISTYQANKLLVVRAENDGLSTLVRTFDRPMGIAIDGNRLALGTRSGVWLFRNAADIAPRLTPANTHDACFLPRGCHVTGDIAVHEMGWGHDPWGEEGDADLWLLNTRFSCLCTLHPDYSFVPRWQPPFISALAAEDRCHLNGLALVAGAGKQAVPRFVTGLGETDSPGGWRPGKACGGFLMEVPSGEVLARGLCMPHSPRWHDGRLYLLESGAGRLVFLDARGACQTLCELPGFTRGLTIVGRLAFIGLSKVRSTSALDGVPLAARREELVCGVAVVDIENGRCLATLEFDSAVEEIFDVQLAGGLRFPEVIGFQSDQVQNIFTVPPREKPAGLEDSPRGLQAAG